IVGRVGLRRIIEAGQRIEQAEHPVKADRRAIKRAEIKTTHLLVLLQKRRGSRASETRRWAGCQALTDPYGVRTFEVGTEAWGFKPGCGKNERQMNRRFGRRSAAIAMMATYRDRWKAHLVLRTSR